MNTFNQYHHLSPAYHGNSDDAHEAWLLARPDVELLEVAIYHLPPHVLKALAGVVRAFYTTPGNDEHLNGALDATALSFADYLKERSEEG